MSLEDNALELSRGIGRTVVVLGTLEEFEGADLFLGGAAVAGVEVDPDVGLHQVVLQAGQQVQRLFEDHLDVAGLVLVLLEGEGLFMDRLVLA